MIQGTIIRVAGPVVDVQFTAGRLPALQEALTVTAEGAERTMEVTQHVNETTVRCIMLSASEGLGKGMTVTATGHGLTAPVGEATLGRMFDYHVLDMVELVLDGSSYRSMESFPNLFKPQPGNKPCFVFTGDAFDNDADFRNIKNILVDFFRGANTREVDLEGVSHIISFVALPERTIRMAVYAIVSPAEDDKGDEGAEESDEGDAVAAAEALIQAEDDEEEGGSDEYEDEEKQDAEDDDDCPDDDPMKGLTLREIGPRVTMTVNRVRFAGDDLAQAARQKPKQLVEKKRKNVDKKHILGVTGKVYPRRQDLGKLTRKVKLTKALREPKKKKPRTQ